MLNALDLYPSTIEGTVKVMFTNFGPAEAARSLAIIKQLREHGISAELYPDSAKMKKQMSRADTLKTPYVAIIGETELDNNTVALKNMSTGEQSSLTVDELIKTLAQD